VSGFSDKASGALLPNVPLTLEAPAEQQEAARRAVLRLVADAGDRETILAALGLDSEELVTAQAG
jgi:hypothetical protein